MLGRHLIVLLTITAPILAACSQGRDYPTNRQDDAYDLAAMALTDDDVPQQMAAIGGGSLDNLAWANSSNPPDDEERDSMVKQLEAQGRISGYVTQYAFDPEAQSLGDAILPHLGRPHLFTVQSTLYTEEHFAY